MKRHVELISTGDELLSGRTLNRHAQVLGECLRPLGLSLARDTTIPDDAATIGAAVLDSLGRVDVVITSGGLGPTCDDLTRDAIAAALDRGVVMDDLSAERIEQKYRKRGLEMSDVALRQAFLVEGAVALENPVGSAPGQRIEQGGKVLFVLPGPPREFLAVLERHVVPWLSEVFGAPPERNEQIFMTTGMGESDIVTMLEKADASFEGIDVAYCAAPARVEIRLSADPGEGARLAKAAEVLRGLLGPHIYAEERLALHEVVARMLTEQGVTLATAESCTGGLLAHWLTSVGGSSAYFLGGVVSYANESKIRDLGVSEALLAEHGAVSEPVAQAMAEGVRSRFGADYGIGVTGIAGPTGGTADKPVGTVCLAVADEAGAVTCRRRFPGDRNWVKEWSCLTVLDLLRRMLGEGEPE